jgi:hypothetical protein
VDTGLNILSIDPISTPDNPANRDGLVNAIDVWVAYRMEDEYVELVPFTFKDGRQTNECGGNYPGGDPFSWSFEGHILSFIWIFGVSEFYKSADCVVYGFRYEDSY